MKSLSHDALCWWWSLSETKQLDIELSCLEEGIDVSDIIYLLSGQVFDDLQRQGGQASLANGHKGALAGLQIAPQARLELHTRTNLQGDGAHAALDDLLNEL